MNVLIVPFESSHRSESSNMQQGLPNLQTGFLHTSLRHNSNHEKFNSEVDVRAQPMRMRMRKNLLETLDSIVKLLMLKSVLEETLKRLWETLGAPLPSHLNAYVPLGRVHSDHLLIFSFTYFLRHRCEYTYASCFISFSTTSSFKNSRSIRAYMVPHDSALSKLYCVCHNSFDNKLNFLRAIPYFPPQLI